MECVYKVAVIAEICECCCPGKFQRIEIALTVAVPLGRSVWMLGKKLASEPAVRALQREFRGRCSSSSPPPAALLQLQLDLTPSSPLLRARMTREGDQSLGWRHGFLLSLHPR